ncbi:MAG: MFS transporter [Chloroflexota bacterium]|nr:MFS transporter [Chloroflexia bacterium]MDQ3467173.1 MFS transporter [Chloroflexota bacterium]
MRSRPPETQTIDDVPASRPRRIHYAWIVAAVTFVTLLGASGFRSTPGVLIVPLQEEFGWSRATISLAVSINLLLFGFGGPFAAALMDRFGIRRVVVGALLAIATGSALTTRMDAPWQLAALWGVVVGLGTASMATVLAATVANRWFVARRGLVLGLLTAASATGQLIFLPVLAWLAANYGWRISALVVASGALLVAPLVAIFMRGSPADMGLRPFGAIAADPPIQARANPLAAAMNGLRLGLQSRDFWLLAGSFFICGAGTNGLIGTHLIPAGIDHGMAEVAAASLLATIGIFDVIGTTLSGWLTDRWDSRYLLFAYYGLRGLSLLYLPFAFDSPNFGLILFIVFYGLDWVATVPPTVALTADAFGKARAPIVFGWIFAAHQLGAASAASAAGITRTLFGDYQPAFIGAGLLSLLAAMMVLRIGQGAAAEPVPSRPLEPGMPLLR